MAARKKASLVQTQKAAYAQRYLPEDRSDEYVSGGFVPTTNAQIYVRWEVTRAMFSRSKALDLTLALFTPVDAADISLGKFNTAGEAEKVGAALAAAVHDAAQQGINEGWTIRDIVEAMEAALD
jgi:hypothetical protein